MNAFAFIGHYLSTDHFCDLLGWPGGLLRLFPSSVLKGVVRILPPCRFLKIPPLTSACGSVVQGEGIIASLLPEHLVTWGEEPVLRKVIAAGHLAERLGAKIVGLAGFTSIVGNEGEELSKHLNIAVTSGNTLTAALALQGIRKATSLMGVRLRDAVVAIIGATGDIGSICTRILVKEVHKLHLAARNVGHVEQFASTIREEGGCDVRVMKYVRDAVRDADIILTATSSITTVIDPDEVKTGAVVCDVAIPHSVGINLVKSRNDILVFEGGLAKLPSDYLVHDWKWRKISPDGVTIFGCLAETVVLALEERWENYSLGRGRITPERVREIEMIADRHGVKLADFRCGNVTFGEKQISSIRANAERGLLRA